MTYEELKKAYEESIKKCSELKKEIEDKDLRIEHLTELLIKRNKLDVFGYLTYLLTVLPEWGQNPTDEQLESVMPWSESLPDFCRQEYDEIIQ